MKTYLITSIKSYQTENSIMIIYLKLREPLFLKFANLNVSNLNINDSMKNINCLKT